MIYFVYKILNDLDEILYVGSTKNIDKRFYLHKYNQFKTSHWDKYLDTLTTEQKDKLKILTICSCDDKYEVRNIEAYYIRKLKPPYNHNIPNRNKKEYYQDNKEQLIKQQCEYYQNNKQARKQYQRNYSKTKKINIILEISA